MGLGLGLGLGSPLRPVLPRVRPPRTVVQSEGQHQPQLGQIAHLVRDRARIRVRVRVRAAHLVRVRARGKGWCEGTRQIAMACAGQAPLAEWARACRPPRRALSRWRPRPRAPPSRAPTARGAHRSLLRVRVRLRVRLRVRVRVRVMVRVRVRVRVGLGFGFPIQAARGARCSLVWVRVGTLSNAATLKAQSSPQS